MLFRRNRRRQKSVKSHEKQSESLDVSILQARQEVMNFLMRRCSVEFMRTPSEEKIKEIIAHLKRLVAFVRADLETLKVTLPREDMPPHEYIEFLIDNYKLTHDLVRDGLYADSHMDGVRKEAGFAFFYLDQYAHQKLRKILDQLLDDYAILTAKLRSALLELMCETLVSLQEVSREIWPRGQSPRHEYMAFFEKDYLKLFESG